MTTAATETIEARLNDYVRGGLVVVSPSMQAVYKQIEQAAGVIANVLILGESGTGKDSVAEAIHANSSRREKKLVRVDIAALPRELLEAELFGYSKGAFTGAAKDRRGRFLHAYGSTIFLNEIGEIDTKLQAKLLSAIEHKEVTRLGEDDPRPIDVRVIAATNRDVHQGMRDETFRSDLYYRLAVLGIQLPPLRERREDIPYLIAHFMQTLQQFHDRKVQPFQPHEYTAYQNGYHWPGNVRELSNAVEKAVITGEDKIGILEKMRQATVICEDKFSSPVKAGGIRPLIEVEREEILRALESAGGYKTIAAKALGINIKTLHNKIRKYGIAPIFSHP